MWVAFAARCPWGSSKANERAFTHHHAWGASCGDLFSPSGKSGVCERKRRPKRSIADRPTSTHDKSFPSRARPPPPKARGVIANGGETGTKESRRPPRFLGSPGGFIPPIGR